LTRETLRLTQDKSLLKTFESRKDLEQGILYVVESLSHQMKWLPAETQDYRKDGKFIIFHSEFQELLEGKEEGKELSFADEAKASHLAKVLSHLSDRPLRVMKVQSIRIQKQVGKVFAPRGGM
jgi:hypothetical protein